MDPMDADLAEIQAIIGGPLEADAAADAYRREPSHAPYEAAAASLSGADAVLPSRPCANPLVNQLYRVWMNERQAPELLPYETDLVDALSSAIEDQTDAIAAMGGDPASDPLRAVLHDQELERLKFMLRAYLRARLAKIEAYTGWLLSPANQLRERLSAAEQRFADGFNRLVNTHYHEAFLSRLPAPLQKLDTREAGMSMLKQPDLAEAVFCRVNTALGDVLLHDGATGAIRMNPGNIYILQYQSIRALLATGDVSLL